MATHKAEVHTHNTDAHEHPMMADKELFGNSVAELSHMEHK